MKSLLVDALRKAQDHTAESSQGDLPETNATDTPEDSLEHIDDLSLYETQAVVAKEGATAENDDLAEDHTLPSAAADDPHISDSETGDLSLSTSVADEVDKQSVSISPRQPLARSVARATPFVCIAMLLSAGAATFVLDKQFTGSINDNLSRTDTQAPETSAEIQSVDKINIFQRNSMPVVVVDAPQSQRTLVPASLAPVSPTNSTTDNRGATRQNEPVIDLSTASVDAPDDRAYEIVVAAYRSYRQNDFLGAEKGFRDALSIAPNHKDALIGLAALYQKTDRNDLARVEYQKLLATDPGNTLAASALLNLRATQSDSSRESEIKHLLQRFPDAHHLHYSLGLLYVGQDKWPDAHHAFRSAYSLAPGVADYSYNLAVSLEHLGEYHAAQQYYGIALAAADEESSFDRTAVKSHLTELENGTGESS